MHFEPGKSGIENLFKGAQRLLRKVFWLTVKQEGL